MKQSGQSHHHKRSLNVGDMTLFTVSAILLLDTLAASASIGVSSLFWWPLLALVFFIPYGMISSEMGTTYPEQGGIYAWVRDTFGKRWGTRVTWLYWLNNVLWSASVSVLFVGMFAALFWPAMSLMLKLGLAILLNWVIFFMTIQSLSIGKWVPNIGAILKMITFTSLIVAGIIFAINTPDQLANEFSWEAFAPQWGSSSQYISTIIYGMLGFELMSSASEEMKNPKRDIPRSIFISGVLIFMAYFLGTFAILAVVPVGEIDLVEGLIDTLRVVFGDSQLGSAAAMTLGLFAMFTFFSNITTWCIGTNRSMAEAAKDGEMPNFLAKEHTVNGTPVGAAFFMVLMVTLVLVFYAMIAETNEDLFWSLFAASAVLFLLPYIGTVAAFYRARQIDADKERPYRVPGGNGFARLITVASIAMLTVCIFLFMYIPEVGFDWPVVIGSIAAIMLGEIAIRYAEHEANTA